MLAGVGERVQLPTQLWNRTSFGCCSFALAVQLRRLDSLGCGTDCKGIERIVAVFILCVRITVSRIIPKLMIAYPIIPTYPDGAIVNF